MKQSTNAFSGMAYVAGASIAWGFLPVYWKLVSSVSAHEILAHRIIWSFIFMVLVMLICKQKGQFLLEVRQVVSAPQKLAGVLAAAVLISLNWFIYIWAVNDNRIVETSLGYYMNPLVNVLLGIVVLKEKLSFWQAISVLLAAMGVFYITVHFGSIPWISISLALSFGLYGLCKKMVNISAFTSVTLETVVIAPAALVYLFYLDKQGAGSFSFAPTGITYFLMGTGVITAIPLLLFANGANRLSLTVLGLIQYLSPTIALFLGVFLYHEPFTAVHLVTFIFIWLALIVFSLAKTPLFIQM
jgi:chloramphenicol-sensitive protein RarD